MSSKNLNDLAEICADALTAFSLELSSGSAEDGPAIEPALSLLKHDEFSLVVKVRCETTNQETSHDSKTHEGAYQDAANRKKTNVYVLKRVSTKLNFGSEETAEVQNSVTLLSGSERLRAADGSYLFNQNLPDGNSVVWSVTRFVPNAPSFDWLDVSPSWTTAQSHSAGNILALLHHRSHQIGAKFAGANFSKLPSAIRSIPEWLVNAFADTFSKELSSEDWSKVSISDQLLILEKIRHSIVQLGSGGLCKVGRNGKQHEIFPGEEKLMIHGDFHPGNVLFLNDLAVGVIDWDFAHLEDPLLELAYGLIMFSGNFAGSAPDGLDQPLANAFLQGYSAGCLTSGWSVYRTVEESSASDSHSEFKSECDVGVLRILLPPYIKLAASLILLWALSRQGQQHVRAATIVRKSVYLILSEFGTLSPLSIDC